MAKNTNKAYQLVPNKQKREHILKALYKYRNKKAVVSAAKLANLIGLSPHAFTFSNYAKLLDKKKKLSWYHALEILENKGLVYVKMFGTPDTKRRFKIGLTGDGKSFAKLFNTTPAKPDKKLEEAWEKTKKLEAQPEEKKEEQKVFALTGRLIYLHRRLNALSKVFDVVCKPTGIFKKKYDLEAIKVIAKEKAEVATSFWTEASIKYPAIKNRPAYSTDTSIILED